MQPVGGMHSNATSVVVPTWQRALWLERCLAGVEDQDPPPSEVIVVGRAEDIEARSIATTRSGFVRWVEVGRSGHIAPVKRGIEESTADFVAILDDDVVPDHGWLAALLEPFSDEGVACVGGRVLTPTMRLRLRKDPGQIRWYGQHIGNVSAIDGSHPFDVVSVMECNWAWRRTVLQELWFDPRLDFDDASMYGLDLTLQARERGYRVVYQPAAVVLNASAPRDPSLDRADRVDRTYSYSRNYSLIASRHLHGFRRACLWLWWLLIGERGSYGVATAIVDLVRGEVPGAVVVASFRGKVAGARVWLSARD